MDYDTRFTFTHSYMNKLSELYSTSSMKVIVYLLSNSTHLTAIIYLTSTYIDYYSHIQYVQNKYNLPERECISRMYINHTSTLPSINEYNSIRINALYKYDH